MRNIPLWSSKLCLNYSPLPAAPPIKKLWQAHIRSLKRVLHDREKRLGQVTNEWLELQSSTPASLREYLQRIAALTERALGLGKTDQDAHKASAATGESLDALLERVARLPGVCAQSKSQVES